MYSNYGAQAVSYVYGGSYCMPCPEGYYCYRGHDKIIAASAGYYTVAGSIDHSICPDRFVCDEQGKLTPCPAGYYCVWNGSVGYASKALPCPAGYYCYEGVNMV